MPYNHPMTTLEFSLEISDRLAPEALAELIENGVRRKATERIRDARSTPGGDASMTREDLQAIVETVRAKP